jgi:cobalt/nickel transport protein
VFLTAVLAPFLASPNPDGLESTAERLNVLDREVELIPSPFSGYALPGISGTASRTAAMLTGTSLVFFLSLAIARARVARNAGN